MSAVPGAPGAAGLVLGSLRAGDKVADATRAASHVPDATTVLNKAEAVADAAGDGSKGADNVLYHYTDAAGAKGIAETGTIRPDARGRVFLTSDKVSAEEASNALFMGQGGSKGTHRAEVTLKDTSGLTAEGATQPNELIHRGAVRDPRNATIKVKENDF